MDNDNSCSGHRQTDDLHARDTLAVQGIDSFTTTDRHNSFRLRRSMRLRMFVSHVTGSEGHQSPCQDIGVGEEKLCESRAAGDVDSLCCLKYLSLLFRDWRCMCARPPTTSKSMFHGNPSTYRHLYLLLAYEKIIAIDVCKLKLSLH